jgi:glutamyl-tRNA synthetase
LWLALRGNLSVFGDIADLATLVRGPVTPVIATEDRDYLAAARDLLPAEPWDETTWSRWTDALKAATGRKGRALFHPLRLALTGREQGPELKSLLPLLGRTESLARLS